MLIPEEYLAAIAPYFQQGVPNADLVVRRIEAMATAPRAMRSLGGGVMMVTARSGLRTIGLSTNGQVTLDPDHADLSTAAGIALLAHEEEHQVQYQQYGERFDALYEQADRSTPRDKPWLNPFELPAYMKERAVYCDKVREGWPKGPWIPLGVQLWGCPVNNAAARVADHVMFVTR